VRLKEIENFCCWC